MPLLRLLVTTVLALAFPMGLAACGENGSGTSSAATSSCPDVHLPGHQAVMLRARGTACATARAVAAAAEGRGRQPYRQRGFACAGTDADAGSTTYACTLGDARVTFLYGTT